MRIEDSKLSTVKALHSIGYDVIAAGDSFNDLKMIRYGKAGFLFKSTPAIIADNPDVPAFEDYPEFLAAIESALA
jgi:phosphoserine/homoserine phosphotransferase